VLLGSLLVAAVELSTIVVPIRASLAPLLPVLESQVPKKQIKLDAYELDPQKKFGMKYRVEREPIRLQMTGNALRATTTVHYAMQGCRRTVKPFINKEVMWPCVSCGFFNERMRDAFITIDSSLSWDANWRLRSLTRAQPAQFPNGCRVTFASINIADWKIAPLVNQQLRQLERTIDANTPKLTNIRPQAQQVWTSLRAPQEIAPRTWLVMEPDEVAMAPITGAGLNVASALVLRARTRVVVGDKPAIAAKPLPPLRTVPATAGGIRVPFGVELSYAEASRLLTESYGRRKYQDISVDTIALRPGTNGKLAVEVNVDYRASVIKKYKGPVLLEGTPVFDPATRTIALKDLDYALDPKRRSVFLRLADHFAHEGLRARLAEGARWSIAPQIAKIRGEIAKAIVRPLAPGVMLRGRVDDVTPVAIGLRPDAIAIDVVATGAAEVEIR
jgi:Domain of unknown function (DUF4403)